MLPTQQIDAKFKLFLPSPGTQSVIPNLKSAILIISLPQGTYVLRSAYDLLWLVKQCNQVLSMETFQTAGAFSELALYLPYRMPSSLNPAIGN